MPFPKGSRPLQEDYRDLKEQIEELIRKGKMQRFVKKGEPSKSRDDNKNQCKASPKDEDRTFQHLPSVIEDIKMITGGSFRSLKKAWQRQVNSVHIIPL